MAYQSKEERDAARKLETAEKQVSIRQTTHQYPVKTDEDYAHLAASHLPADCPGAFAKAAPCLGCPARVDCDENGRPPKAKVEHGVTTR